MDDILYCKDFYDSLEGMKPDQKTYVMHMEITYVERSLVISDNWWMIAYSTKNLMKPMHVPFGKKIETNLFFF